MPAPFLQVAESLMMLEHFHKRVFDFRLQLAAPKPITAVHEQHFPRPNAEAAALDHYEYGVSEIAQTDRTARKEINRHVPVGLAVLCEDNPLILAVGLILALLESV